MITSRDLNRRLIDAQYAVRGPIVIRAQQLEEQGRKIIYCNIGNPQALKQKPVSFLRQTLCLLEFPELIKNPELVSSIPSDIVHRAKQILTMNPHGMGAYTQSTGIPFVRQAVADFIQKRDGIASSKDRIILTDGASKGAQSVLVALLKEPSDGFMIPIPQYPLYSASLTLYGGRQIGYYLDEENSWQLNEEALVESLSRSNKGGIHPVGIVVINPGNPTGAVLSYENIKMVVTFAKRHGLSIIADEVYQENVYDTGARFYSFAKVMNDMKETDVSLFSLHSVSKGFLGECGHRGGYLEIRNVPDEVISQFVKLQSISLCANVSGQIATYLMVSPPQPGDESYETYKRERDGILSCLREKAEILGKGIGAIAGMSVDIPQGAMYAFVKIQLPIDRSLDTSKMTTEERLLFDAERDSAYCMRLLEETGICIVPGSGFGQLPGTLHFRTTFLPPRTEIEEFVSRLKHFHEEYTRSEAVSL
jgi:aspartate/methionine/tyrosine aminotransferase